MSSQSQQDAAMAPTSHPQATTDSSSSQPESLSAADALRAQKEKLKAKLLGKSSSSEKKPKPSDILIAQGEPHPATSAHPSESSSPPQGGSLAQVAYGSPRRSSSPFAGATSPGRQALRSETPRHLSPATSQIFERDVQESVVVPEMSPAIPAHIQTEDHIPPALNASSHAITDQQLGPDEVEIIQHSAHQPQVDLVAAGAGAGSDVQMLSQASHSGEHLDAAGEGENLSSSTYGAVDPMDPRRLSFISFADVVHAEHAEVGHMGLGSGVHSVSGGRSPSPIRSPLSQSIPLSPPMSGSQSGKDMLSQGSPGRAGAASPASLGHGELTIETMRHALQQAGTTTEAGGTASSPPSAVGNDDGSAPRSFR